MGQNYVSYYDMERIAREIRGMRGAGNGVAPLDESGHVPAANLPSYVDDVLEYATQSAFPATGESGKIYIAADTNKTYRWTGSLYVDISSGEVSVELKNGGATANTMTVNVNGKTSTATVLLGGAAQSSTNKVTNTSPGKLAAGHFTTHQVYNADGPTSYGNIINVGGSGGTQIFQEWTGGQTSAGQDVDQHLWIRSQRDNQSAFTAWKKVANIDDIIELDHNVPRKTPKDITAYYTDGALWNRIAGTSGYALFEDIYVGDYFKMSRAVSAYERTGTYQTTGSQYVTIAGIDTMWGNGDSSGVSYHHLVMVPGQGFGGTQHFGRSRMNPSNVTTGGYKSSEMFTETIGAVATSGSTAGTATINQQLYAEFGSHLKTTRELVSSSVNASGYNRFGAASGCSNNWEWVDAQAVLMSEVEVYGSVVFSSSAYDTGNANTRLPLFAYSKQAVNNGSAYYWLKDVASGADFCSATSFGNATCNYASHADRCVRPRFILAA